MRILQVHNKYLLPGGEDSVVAAEKALLESRGHVVAQWFRDNAEIANLSRARVALGAVWSRHSRAELDRALDEFRPDIVHFHNTFPLISPSAYYAASARRIAVVQTLHNYRMICPAGTLFRDGHVCLDCLDKTVPWPGVRHSCYRQDIAASATIAGLIGVHRIAGTWANRVDAFLAPSEFTRDIYVAGGFPAERLYVKPNFVASSLAQGSPAAERRGAIFVGRLSREKGIDRLVEAWRSLDPGCVLGVLGDGPLGTDLRRAEDDQIRWLGWCPTQQVLSAMDSAQFLVAPSRLPETFGLSVIEGFSRALPAIVPDFGAMAELVKHGETGLRFRSDDTADLKAQISWALAHPAEMRTMGRRALDLFEEKYSQSVNGERLAEVYVRAQDTARARSAR